MGDKMEEGKVVIAIEIIQRKIARLIKDNKEKEFKKFNKELKKLVNDREKIYNLDEDTIERIYKEAFKEKESHS